MKSSSNDSMNEYGSIKYFIYCGFSSMISCDHTTKSVRKFSFVIQIFKIIIYFVKDVVKCRLQVNEQKYNNLFTGIKITVR